MKHKKRMQNMHEIDLTGRNGRWTIEANETTSEIMPEAQNRMCVLCSSRAGVVYSHVILTDETQKTHAEYARTHDAYFVLRAVSCIQPHVILTDETQKMHAEYARN